MNLLIDSAAQRYVFGIAPMDKKHQEFMDLLNQLGATEDKVQFVQLFTELVRHTEAHFDMEKTLMEESAFPSSAEHNAEHLRVLGEMHRFEKRVARGSLALGRAYVNEQLPGWFELHASTMDSALAAHLKVGS